MSKKERIYHRGLRNLSPLDGREVLFVDELRSRLSEGALHRSRAKIQIENMIALSESGLAGFPEISEEEKKTLRGLYRGKRFDPRAVAAYDHFGRNGKGPFEHDVKSVEVYLRELLEKKNLQHLQEFVHFPMTSEDVNNLAWNLMLRDAVNNAWLPRMLSLCDKLAEFADSCADLPVLGKTHGMNASPTTFGKRFAHFLGNFMNVLVQMQSIRLSGKYSGPVGNHNAMTVAAPDFHIGAFAKKFVESFGFRYDIHEDQRNSHIEITRLFDEVKRVNIIAMSLCEHIRHSVMLGYFIQEGKESNVGSSVMPHKVNPWAFEVAQGLFEKSNALIERSTEGLILTIFERDLTDHPWERSYGEMLGYSLAGLGYMLGDLDTIQIDDVKACEELRGTPEILTEAVQIVGRLCGVPNIYMKIKEESRGKRITLELLHAIIDRHIPDPTQREKLKSLSPEEYVGKAPLIAKKVASEFRSLRHSFGNGLLHPVAGIRAVLFDFDNPLQVGDKKELIARLGAISENMRLGFTGEQIYDFGNRSDYKEMVKLMVNAYNAKSTNGKITAEDFDAENKKVSGTFDHFFSLAPGAKELLEGLKKRGYTRALVTTPGSTSLPRLLKMHEITDSFDVIIDRDRIKAIKPHPAPISLALSELGVHPDHAAYIGDKQTDDIIAGRALGLYTILVNNEERDPRGAIPHHHFQSLEAVLPLFCS